MDEKQFTKARFVALAMLAVAPAVYLVVAWILQMPFKTGGEIDLMFYILLIVAMVQPAAVIVIERHQVNAYRARGSAPMTPSQLLFSIMIIKAAIVEAVFLYGLIVYLLSGDMLRMLWFYPIGAAWTVIYWPRREKWNSLIRTLEVR